MLSLSDLLQGAQLIVQVMTGRRRSEAVVVQGQPKPPMDIRVAATALIWLCATGILGIWMIGFLAVIAIASTSPFLAGIVDTLTATMLIPLGALLAAGIVTARIWRVPAAGLDAAGSTRQFEERLANLEMQATRESLPVKRPRDQAID